MFGLQPLRHISTLPNPCGPGRELANGGYRRMLPVAPGLGEGLLTEPTAAAQPLATDGRPFW